MNKNNSIIGTYVERDGYQMKVLGKLRGGVYGIEDGQFISELVPSWPLDEDPASVGAAHFRTTKGAVQNTFPRFSSEVEMSSSELNWNFANFAQSGTSVDIGQQSSTTDVNIHKPVEVQGGITADGDISTTGDITAFATTTLEEKAKEYPRLTEEGITDGTVSLWAFLEAYAQKTDEIEARQLELEEKYEAISTLFSGLIK